MEVGAVTLRLEASEAERGRQRLSRWRRVLYRRHTVYIYRAMKETRTEEEEE